MKLHTLVAPLENKKTRKRVGRGQGSGTGEQSGRGHKGQKAGSGYSKKLGFEGGQMPLQRRIPKFGFTNHNRVEFRPINLSKLSNLMEEGALTSPVTKESLIAAGAANKNDKIKLLGTGDISASVEITVDAASKSAVEKIEKAGGSVTIA